MLNNVSAGNHLCKVVRVPGTPVADNVGAITDPGLLAWPFPEPPVTRVRDQRFPPVALGAHGCEAFVNCTSVFVHVIVHNRIIPP